MAIDPRGSCARCRDHLYVQDDTVPQLCDKCVVAVEAEAAAHTKKKAKSGSKPSR